MSAYDTRVLTLPSERTTSGSMVGASCKPGAGTTRPIWNDPRRSPTASMGAGALRAPEIDEALRWRLIELWR